MVIAGIALGTLVAIIGGLLAWSAHGVRMSVETTVDLDPASTWAFFENPENLAGWDRSVASVEPTTTRPVGVGYTFDTIGPEQRGETTRSSYRVVEYHPPQSVRIDLVDSEQFARAAWHVTLEPKGAGTRILIDVDFVTRPQFCFLTPVLYFNRDNLVHDMQYLHDAIEAHGRRG